MCRANVLSLALSLFVGMSCIVAKPLFTDDGITDPTDDIALIQEHAQIRRPQSLRHNSSLTDSSSADIRSTALAEVTSRTQQDDRDSGKTGLSQNASHEVEFEVPSVAVPIKNKMVLAILELLGFGFCGVDRCYMGQTCFGVLKGISFGGFFIWFFIDYVAIAYSCLATTDFINTVGLRANFEPHDATIAAWWVMIIALIAQCVLFLGAGSSFILRPLPAKEDMDKTFKTMDKNQSGHLDSDELKIGMAKLGCTDRQVERLLKLAKVDKDGKIDYNEFTRVVHETFSYRW